MKFVLNFPVTRDFRWPWFAPAALLGAIVTLIFLTLINGQSNAPLPHQAD